jgi:hypothetical protein
VSFAQQDWAKASRKRISSQVDDCVTIGVLYFQVRKQGRLIVRFLNLGMGQGTLSFSKRNPDPFETF